MRSSALVFALCTALALPAASSAAPSADLRVPAVSSGSSQEAPGSRFTGSATVLNAGTKTAPPSRLGFYLSRDRRKGSGDFRLSPRPRVGARRPASRARLLRTFTVPRRVPPGAYALIACADDTRRVRERRERNNCRSVRRRIRVVVPIPPMPTPVPPATGSFMSPSLGVNGPPNGSATFDTTPNYSGTAGSPSAGIARVEARADAAPFSTLGVNCLGCGIAAFASWTFSPVAPLADGVHSFNFRAIDGGGRSSPVITRTLTVDTIAPTFNSIVATPGSSSITVTFSEPLSCATVNAFDFSAEINAAAVVVDQVSCTASGATITLSLASAPIAGANVGITLSGVVSDPAGNVAPRPTTRSDTA